MNLLPSLRYLVALNEHRHFGRAAQACHITQPALSNALRALEAEFSAVIVKRDRNYVGFTPEGEIILASAQRMLHEHALLQDLPDASILDAQIKFSPVPTFPLVRNSSGGASRPLASSIDELISKSGDGGEEWQQARDSRGRLYWFNSKTRETRWEEPK